MLGDECLKQVDELSPPQKVTKPNHVSNFNEEGKLSDKVPAKKEDEHVPAPRDLYALIKEHANKDEKVGELWRQVNTVPEWVDWDQIARGQDVFYRYGGAALTGLTYQSLLGGMGAGKVVETLARTGGFSTKVARRRLYETAQHIIQVTKSLDSIKPGGAGHASTIRVRLLHASVRNRIMKLRRERPEYYNVEEWGIPINDLDSIGTISTFSSSLIWVSFPKQGIFVREQEAKDFLALWRYVAYVIGCPDDYFSTPAKAKALMETLLYNEIDPTSTSRILANNMIKSLEGRPPTYASGDMLIASARWLNGNELVDKLGLPKPSLYYWALMAGQCTFYIIMCYLHRSIPYLDRRKIATFRRVFYALIVESKYGLEGKETVFDFKYVPEYSTLTEMGIGSGAKVSDWARVEGRNLLWLCGGFAFLGICSWVSLRTASAIWGVIW